MFTVEPSEIEHFDGLQLVALLRVLLHAEARRAGVPLRNVDVPLQITIADGGQDATVRWQHGANKTDYFPGRDIIFQCKATDHGNAKWTSEVWTKQSQSKKIKTKVLNKAVGEVLARGGSYIGITASPLVGTKAADRSRAIEEGIRQAGGDPADLSTVEVYEANKLAAWASVHPAVALWVKEQKAGIPLAGFSTLDQWGKRADIATPPFVGSGEREFSLGSSRADVLDFAKLAERIVDHLDEAGACVRVWGASGIGKTRALHQALSTTSGTLRELAASNFIFCDFRDVPTKIRDVANQIKNEGTAAVLVVDNCPLDEARQLNDLARAEGSQLRVVTIGAEGRDQIPNCLAIRPKPADQATIAGILSHGLPTAKPDQVRFIADFCDGFPGIAVLAAGSYSGSQSVLKSADDVAEQIIKGARLDRDTIRALECLSLFEHLEPDEQPQTFDALAGFLAHMTGGLMFEHLVAASEQHLVERGDKRMSARPRPIADYLALRRLSYLRASTIVGFLLAASTAQRDAMLGRWRHIARSRTLADVVQLMLRGPLSNDETLLATDAAPFLAPFVHIDPEATATALFWAIQHKQLDDLTAVTVSDGLLHALRLIASRRSSFQVAALMVLRLAAVADLGGSPPILALLRQLFQVALAGTEADDRRRRDALAEALEDDDLRMKRVCVEALGAMLQTYISRSDDFEQVGSEDFREEWRPEHQDTVNVYFKWALEQLLEVWKNVPDVRPAIQDIVAGDLRNLLNLDLLPAIQGFVETVVATDGHWFEATKSIGDWLYFDRPGPPDEFAAAVRALYDATLPAQAVDQALLYSRFWAADIRDPDTRYADTVEDLDFEYSTRRAQALAPAISRDPDQLARLIDAMATEEMHAPYALAEALAGELIDPLGTFASAVAALDGSGSRDGIGFVRALLSSLDRRLASDAGQVEELVKIAETSKVLSASPMNIHTALRVTDERAGRLATLVREGAIGSQQVVPISYGRGLANISAAILGDLIEALVDRSDEGGAWAALEILSMVTHDDKQLSPPLTALVKRAILSPEIADGVDGNSNHTDYVHDLLLRKLAVAGAIDGAFARAFALQIERACRSVGGSHNRPMDALRAGLAIVVKIAPQEIWAGLAGFYDVATRAERERLNAIASAARPFAWDDESRTGPGPLFDAPQAPMIDWADEDVDGRAPFLVSFFPILEHKGGWRWHLALEQLATRYGGSKRFRGAVRSRIFPSSWGGSLDAHLTSFKEPLASWVADPVLGDWARTMLEAIDQRISDDFDR